MLYRTILLAIFISTLAPSLSAQQIKRVQGIYEYIAPENVSISEAKETALYRAKIQALADQFGTVVSDHHSTIVSNRDGSSSVDFSSMGSSSVKGEWIETVGEPEFEIRYEQNSIIVTCRVVGRAREISTAAVRFDAKILRNGTDAKYEDYDFRNNDDMYLSFTSPSDGYIAVYLVDSRQTAYCLLPYSTSNEGFVKIRANTGYVLFSKDNANPWFDPSEVDEYTLFTDRSSETNFIYIIFSPSRFIKAVDGQGSHEQRILPRELTFDEFQKWLARNRTHDSNMQLEIKTITIAR